MGVRAQAAWLLALIGMLLGAAAGMFMMERHADLPAAVALQRAVAGLGLGASVVPAWSFNAFDPRAEPICESSDWPLPGGVCYSPDHVGPVSHFRAPAGLKGIPRLVRR